MKFKKIVGFGDSWMYGDELLDPDLVARDPRAHTCWVQNANYRNDHCFLGRLGQHYRVPVKNYGIPGGSLQSSIWSFLYWLQEESHPENCLVLLGHTAGNRQSFYDPRHQIYGNTNPWAKFVHSTWTNATEDVVSTSWKTLMKSYTVMCDCTELSRLNHLQTALLFDGQSARRNIPMLQFHVISSTVKLEVPTAILQDLSLRNFLLDHLENRDIHKPEGHPNEKGHEIIRDLLIPEIDRVILSQ